MAYRIADAPPTRLVRPRSVIPVARRIAPAADAAGSTSRPDARRLVAAALSALVPGLGQLLDGHRRLGLALGIPVLAIAAVAGLMIRGTPPMRLLAWVVAPSTLDALLALNVALLGWRLFAVGHAFFDRRHRTFPGRAGIIGVLVIAMFVVIPHAAAYYYGSIAREAFGQFFSGTDPATSVRGGAAPASHAPAPGPNERLNVLLLGLDANPQRDHALTDSMMVASIDPVLGTASIVSIPRDLVGVPLGDGRTFGPKLNSLLSYATLHPGQFPKGGLHTLEDAVGTLLGIRIDYFATLDLNGFIKLVDAVGGVDVMVDESFFDPMYDGWDGTSYHFGPGWRIKAGLQHLDGVNALAYARSRYAVGGSDFKRAARQQQILVALKQKLTSGGSILLQLPQLLRTLGDIVRTDLPPDRLPDLAGLADTLDASKVVRVVIGHPLVKGGTRAPYGSVQIPDLQAILTMAKLAFPPVGTPPATWPPASAIPATAPSPSPKG